MYGYVFMFLCDLYKGELISGLPVGYHETEALASGAVLLKGKQYIFGGASSFFAEFIPSHLGGNSTTASLESV